MLSRRCTAAEIRRLHISRALMPRAMRSLGALVLLATLAGGCARARAADVPVGPPLAMPPPPERVLAPVEEAPLVTAPGRAETPLTPAPEVVQQRPPAPRAPAPAEQTRREPPPPAPAASPATGPVAGEVSRQVRTPSSAEETAQQRDIRNRLAAVAADLNRVSQKGLTGASKQQFEDARSLWEVASKALSERDYEYARTQADKAAQLANALTGR